jgi:hypothetical protein
MFPLSNPRHVESLLHFACFENNEKTPMKHWKTSKHRFKDSLVTVGGLTEGFVRKEKFLNMEQLPSHASGLTCPAVIIENHVNELK